MRKGNTKQGQRTKRLLREGLTKISAHTLLLLCSVLFLFPFFWMISASLKTSSDLLGGAQSLVPTEVTWQNYYDAFFTTMPLLRNFGNSVFIATSYTLLSVFFCSLGGFAFAKYTFPGDKALFAIMMGTMMVPGVVGLVPSFIIMKELGWVNTFYSVIIPGTAHAFGIFFMRQYIQTIPNELLDAAKIDGSGDFGIYWRIVLPVASPALITLAIMEFIGSWNSYMWPLIMLRTKEMYTLVLAITSFPSVRFREPWGAIMAASTVSVLPLVILFLAFQRRIISGITLGSLKGV